MRQSFHHIELGYSIEPKGASRRLIQQVHGGTIIEHTESVLEADGVFTHNVGEPIHVFTADCIPLLFFSEDHRAPIIAVHCGWRGAMNRIALNAMVLLKDFSVQVVVGPSILKCCFEVREDLIGEFKKNGHVITPFLHSAGNKIYFNLVDYVIDSQLKGAVIHRDWSRCTVCSTPALPSYRRNKSTDPQIRSWIVKTN